MPGYDKKVTAADAAGELPGEYPAIDLKLPMVRNRLLFVVVTSALNVLIFIRWSTPWIRVWLGGTIPADHYRHTRPAYSRTIAQTPGSRKRQKQRAAE